MYAVEFQASIKDGIVHIPKEYQDIQNSMKATFVVMYENINNSFSKDKEVQAELDEFHRLVGKSNNKVMVTLELATNTDGMIDDGIL